MTVCSHGTGGLGVRNCAIVVGSNSSDEAKIGGITPEVLSFSGRCDGLAAEHPIADLALGILHQQAALRALHEHDEGDHADDHAR